LLNILKKLDSKIPFLFKSYCNMLIRKIFTLALLSSVFIFTSCEDPVQLTDGTELKNATKIHKSTVAQEWLNLYMEVEKDLPGFRPAATSRALAYIWMAAYETGLPGMPNNITVSKKLNFTVPTIDKPVAEYDFNIAVNAALGRTNAHFLINSTQDQKNLIASNEKFLHDQAAKGVSANIVENSVAWGRKVADAVIAYSKTDLEAEKQILDAFPDEYTPPGTPGTWKAEKGKSLFPYWGKTRSFATFGKDLISPPPPAYSTNPSSTYYKDYYEVYDNVKNLTSLRRWKAEFWSDDIVGLTFSPPARIFQIANQMIGQENEDLEFSLNLLLHLGIAENDAAVAAWGTKYTYHGERPNDFIIPNIDKNFRTPLGFAIGTDNITPPFPGYPSGHSTFGGLGISVLAHYFGESYTFTDRCHEGRTEFYGTPRTYTTMTQIGEENAFSRIPLGVHARYDCTEGLRLGRMIGTNAVNFKLTKF
jgi:hypothetical protein